jgi:stage II sporulation protein D
VSGRVLRETLGLRSNWFDVTVNGQVVVFSQRGYGHGVGMPQNGADGWARQGATYEQILHHYYSGVQLVQWY